MTVSTLQGLIWETSDDTIRKLAQKEYNKLMLDVLFLTSLQNVGVDNWEGYSEAQELFDVWLAEDKRSIS